jgi:RNA polymerase sigma-70 factor (ECF subfamily)
MAFAAAIAFNEVRNVRRRKKRSSPQLSEGVLETLEAHRAVESTAESIQQIAIEHCLAKLPTEQRTLLETYYRDPQERALLSERLTLTPTALRMRMHRIRRQLIDCVDRFLARKAPS